MKYEFLPKTADAKFRAYGKTLEEAFESAALAMMSLVVEGHVKAKIGKSISVEGKDLKDVLYNFLEELLVLMDTEQFLLSKIKKIKITKKEGYALHADISGDMLANYTFRGVAKAVTYNEMEIHEEKGKCFVQVVIDT